MDSIHVCFYGSLKVGNLQEKKRFVKFDSVASICTVL